MAKKMTFKLRFEGTVGVSHVDIQGESLPGRGGQPGQGPWGDSVPDVLQDQ